MNVDQEQIVEEAVRNSKRPRGRRLVLGLAVLSILLLITTGFLAWKLLYKPTLNQAQAGTDLAAQIQQACENPKQDTATLHNLCEDADNVVEDAPNTVQGPPGEQGDPGTPGEPGPPPSDAQVQNAVALYCAQRGACRGPRGDSVTQAQVAEAVASYCNANGECRGPAGTPGSAGQNGAPGEPGERGEQGPAPTDQQIESAVANYCSTRNNCQGPKGEPGAPGSPGEPGPTGVVNVDASGCSAQEGQVVQSVASTYDPGTRTVVITCTFVSNGILGGTQ